jgi:2-phosphosulfolactate phosphatase
LTQKPLHLGLYSTLAEFSEGQAKGKLVVVIDVLRAASTIVQACENQVERIIPVAGVEDASKLVPTLERKKTLLGGESEGRKIEGFDLGNSPLEYTLELVKGKTLILSTTNGTVAITRSAPADEIVVGCLLNLGAVVAHLASSGADSVALLCSGNLGQLALEDFLCGGLVVARLAGRPGIRGRHRLLLQAGRVRDGSGGGRRQDLTAEGGAPLAPRVGATARSDHERRRHSPEHRMGG